MNCPRHSSRENERASSSATQTTQTLSRASRLVEAGAQGWNRAPQRGRANLKPPGSMVCAQSVFRPTNAQS
eukprot:15432168-Alexandrium_andersonii.AAC.1